MTPPTPRTATAALDRLVARAGELDGGAGPSRRRQLRWVAGELAAHAERVGTLPRSPAGWLAPERVADYLRVADAGGLRRRGASDRPSPDATRRVRRACLRLMARAAGVAEPVTDAVPLPAPHPRVEPAAASRALAHWRGRTVPAHAAPGEVRAAAMAALVHEASLRSGELAALRVADLDLTGPDGPALTYRPRPPAARAPLAPVTVGLSPSTAGLLQRWLSVRADLVRATPRTRALWVSLRANHDGDGVRRPAGLPLQPGGIRRAHARAVTEANTRLAGAPDWAPLPRTPGLLRPDPLRAR
ncbi:hypothetical protein [Nocardioides perillae]|uniref:Integrase n=1 Tax=Nocardioides perillae TaxID=1119534 RepID=A0A7Y9RWA3_9ACTN|nr:hypothetical protein [Nocardioides perillae]NYG55983.1 integrase [Nocardioides perillae]